MKELKGTEIQIALAREIREYFIKRLENTSDEKIECFTLNSAEVMKNAAKNMLETEADVNFYIKKIHGKDIYDALFVALSRYVNRNLTNKQKEMEKIASSYLLELKEIDGKFRFTTIKYPRVIRTMEKIGANEIGYNKYGQFIWEKGREYLTREAMTELLQNLGFAVFCG